MDCPSDEGQQFKENDTDLYKTHKTTLTSFSPNVSAAFVPDSDHLPLYAGRVQLLHAADVPRPLELLRVDEEDRLLHPWKDLIV